MKYLEPIPTIEVIQGDYKFYLFTINAKSLLSVAYTNERTKDNKSGIQRGLRKDRLISIGKYLQGEVSGPPVLPNAIIVSLSKDSYFEKGLLHIANKEAGEAFVIDGQHRLWSFQEEFSNDTDLNLVVSAFIELPDDKKALVFKTINGEQRKINPSLVYDLIPMLREKNWVEFESWRAQEIVSFLNDSPKSPWANRISMVGEPGKIISQSSFITAIKKLFKKDHLLSIEKVDFTESVIQENLLLIYFKAISDAYSIEWDNKDYLLCKYVGVSALLNLLELIVADIQRTETIIDDTGLRLTTKMLNPYIVRLRAFNFDAKEMKSQGKSFVGEGGVKELFKIVHSTVFPQ
ncbi:DGQHR domain-containing protein [Niabella sp. 22666]|uniref:DGQHR domain-containing protein n=1 Tax=Niabella sp. 22666 TaxID=3453954 RepID=UPI003F83FB25